MCEEFLIIFRNLEFRFNDRQPWTAIVLCRLHWFVLRFLPLTQLRPGRPIRSGHVVTSRPIVCRCPSFVYCRQSAIECRANRCPHKIPAFSVQQISIRSVSSFFFNEISRSAVLLIGSFTVTSKTPKPVILHISKFMSAFEEVGAIIFYRSNHTQIQIA